MAPKEKATFFQYSIGQPTDLLTLGTLIWEDYANPELARHWTCPRLSSEALEEHAYMTPLENCVLSDSHSRDIGIGLELLVGASADISLMTVKEKCVAATSGVRVVLKELHKAAAVTCHDAKLTSPASFINTQLSAQPEGKDKLRLWLSAARDAYYLKMRWIRQPKVWVLTGYYQLSQARSFHTTTHEPSGSLGVDSVTIGALTTAPVGASISLGNGKTVKAEATIEGPCIWAARYQMLQLKYLNVPPTNAPVPTALQLLPNTFSHGTLRSSIGEDFNAIAEPFEVHSEFEGEQEEHRVEPKQSAEVPNLYDSFEQAIKDLQRMVYEDLEDE